MKSFKKVLVGVIALVMTFMLTSCSFVGGFILGIIDGLFGGFFEEDISLEYTLTQDDLTEFTSLVKECEEAGMSESGAFKLSMSLMEMVSLLDYIDAQSTVGYLEYCQHQSDPTALQHYTESEEIYMSARTQYLALLKKLEAESPIREELFADWSEEELKMLRVDNDKIAALQLSTSELTRQFYTLDEEAETWSASVSELYEKVVANNQNMAKEYGYTNYYDLANELIYTRKYTSEQRTTFRGYVAQYVVPMYADIMNAYSKSVAALTKSEIVELELIYSNTDSAFAYMDTLGNSLGGNMEKMLTKPNAAIFGQSSDSLEGAFTTYMGYFSQPIAYFGPGYNDVYTIIHEAGHFAAYYNYGNSTLPFDLAEVHSQGNEWLYTAYVQSELSANVYKALCLEKAVNGLTTVIYSTLVDHFEELVYTAETSVKTTEYANVMATVCAQYKGLEKVMENLVYTPFEYAQHVTLTSPGYYLSYATSQIASMGVYVLAEEQGYEKAAKAYVALQEIEDISLAFAEAIEKAGLPGPFTQSTYEKIKNTFLSVE